jgi:RNA polymerase sigma-70 factor (ECF subfamily)
MFNNSTMINEMDNLRKFAYKLTQNNSDADDLLQATILRAYEKKHLFQKDTNLFSWSSKIMFNLFVSNYRRKTKFETQYDPSSYIERESVEATQDIKMELRDVEEAIMNLSEDHQEILKMVCIKGMQYAEVSEMLQIPVGTVRSRLSRARESLQAELETPQIPGDFIPPVPENDVRRYRAAA